MSLQSAVEKVLQRLRSDPEPQRVSAYVDMLQMALEASQGPPEEVKIVTLGTMGPPPTSSDWRPRVNLPPKEVGVDYSQRLAQAIEKRSRREAEERSLIEGGVKHCYQIRGGPSDGDYVYNDEAYAGEVRVGGESYVVEGMFLRHVG